MEYIPTKWRKFITVKEMRNKIQEEAKEWDTDIFPCILTPAEIKTIMWYGGCIRCPTNFIKESN